MNSIEERLGKLERDLARAMDRLEICQRTAAYGPLVDSGDSEGAAALWTPDGVYDWGSGLAKDSETAAAGQDQLRAIFNGAEHRSIIRNGAAHWLSPPHVVIDGDRAISLCYSALLVRDAQGFRLARVSICHFEWSRSPGGWRIARRRNRLLDGSAEAAELLVEGVNQSDFGRRIDSTGEADAATTSDHDS